MDHEPAAASRRALRSTLVKPGYSIGTLGNLVVAVSREPPTVESTLDVSVQLDALWPKYPKGVSLVFAPRAPRPALSAKATRTLLAEWRRLEPHLACAVIVFGASTLGGAIQRSLTTAVLRMHSGRVPIKASSSPFDAAAFITRHDAEHPAAQLLGLSLQSFIQEHER